MQYMHLVRINRVSDEEEGRRSNWFFKVSGREMYGAWQSTSYLF